MAKNHTFDTSKIRLAVGMPISAGYKIPADTFASYEIMMDNLPGGISYKRYRSESGSIESMRNNIVCGAFDDNMTHLFMIDADMVFLPETLVSLLSTMLVRDLDIIAPVFYRRYPPYDPLVFQGTIDRFWICDDFIDMPPADPIIEVTAVGTGCMLINMRVFNKMLYPWFEVKHFSENKIAGEDIWFCHKARELGFKVHVDTSMHIGHLFEQVADRNLYLLWRQLIKQGIIQRRTAQAA